MSEVPAAVLLFSGKKSSTQNCIRIRRAAARLAALGQESDQSCCQQLTGSQNPREYPRLLPSAAIEVTLPDRDHVCRAMARANRVVAAQAAG